MNLEYIYRTESRKLTGATFSSKNIDLSLGRTERHTDDSPATIKARNVLYLIDDMFFEEKLFFPDMEGTTGSSTPAPEPLFRQYPNPIAGILNLEYTETITEPLNVAIFNLLNNEKVYEGQMEYNLFSLDVSAWTTGFYSIVVQNREGREMYKSSTKIKN